VDFIQRWRPAVRPVAVRLPPWRRVPLNSALHDIELRSSVRGRDVRAEQPLLLLARVPAGDYRLVVDGTADLRGMLSVTIGASSQPLETWSIDGLRRGEAGLRLHLPTLVHSVTIRGDDLARSSVRHLGLRPEVVRSGEPVGGRYTLRAARYGEARAFFLDDGVFVEPGGMWTRGDSVAELVVTGGHGGVAEFDVMSGPVPTDVDLSVDGALQHITFAPNERRRLQVSTGLWKIATTGKFRPKDHDPTSSDARSLGVRLEFAERTKN
jgi:hypothetical protein